LVSLRKGQAIFQDAGIPHAYLCGQNIELMANSDNVLRGGLTEKHVDVPELLSTVRLEGLEPCAIEGASRDNPFEAHFECPAQDFHLSRIQLGKGDSWANSTQSVEVLLLMEGTVTMDSDQQYLNMDKGQSAILFGGSEYRIRAMSKSATLFRASLP
jgi:mannose-6-phosphate isomerase